MPRSMGTASELIQIAPAELAWPFAGPLVELPAGEEPFNLLVHGLTEHRDQGRGPCRHLLTLVATPA